MFSFSTCWNSWRHRHAAGMIEEIRSLGFEYCELSFLLSAGLYQEIPELFRQGRIKFSSLHNYCPPPLASGLKTDHLDGPSLSSLDERERNWAARQTMRTIDAAKELGAGAVVLHLGKIKLGSLPSKLRALAESGGRESRRYRSMKERLLKKRRSRGEPYAAQALKSLRRLAEYAEERKIALGIETRYSISEFPSLDEIGILLEAVDSPFIGYWHDVGHAQVKENLGLEEHEEYLGRYGDRLVGMHIHDVTLSRDHKPPGRGEFDFRRIENYLRMDTIKVFEIHPPASPEEVREGVEFIKSLAPA